MVRPNKHDLLLWNRVPYLFILLQLDDSALQDFIKEAQNKFPDNPQVGDMPDFISVLCDYLFSVSSLGRISWRK